jgi:phosphoglycolate phosphatase
VLFDLDGTLSHSEPGIVGTLKLAFAELGLPVPSDEQLRTTIGPPFRTGLPAIGVPEDQVATLTTVYRAMYDEAGLFETTLYDGIGELLERLGDLGHTLCVATAKPETSARRVIEHLGVAHHFKVLGAASDDYVVHAKADVIAGVLDRLGLVGGSDVVMIGDRRHDVEGAAVHGIDTIGATWGYGSPSELREAGAWALADRAGDVLPLVGHGA